MKNTLFISAGAGSGKTHRITDFLFEELAAKRARPEAVLATTFTKKAASELVERVRQRLALGGQHRLASSMGQALIGTVNSVCGRLLGRYAFEAGLSPALEVLDEDASALLFSQALEQSLESSDIDRMNALARRLEKEDWKGEIKGIVDLARANNIPAAALPAQAERSLANLMAFFPSPSPRIPMSKSWRLPNRPAGTSVATTTPPRKQQTISISCRLSKGNSRKHDSLGASGSS